MTGYKLDEASIAQLRRDHAELWSLMRGVDARLRSLSGNAPPVNRHKFRNDSGEVIPPLACMRITNGTLGYDSFFTVAKPNATQQKVYLLNHTTPVQPGALGWAQKYDEPNGAAYGIDFRATTRPAYGQTWGPTNGSWLLSSTGTGFTVLAFDQGKMLVHQVPTFERKLIQWGNATLKDTSLTDGEFNATYGASMVYNTYAGTCTQADLGITHDTSVSSPLTDGSFTVTKAGTYKFNFYWRLIPNETSNWGSGYETSSIDGSPSHSHTVVANLACTAVAAIVKKPYGGSSFIYDLDGTGENVNNRVETLVFSKFQYKYLSGSGSCLGIFTAGDKLNIRAYIVEWNGAFNGAKLRDSHLIIERLTN